jgi:Ser-tRNA(Ala) deacylase AlaX
MINANPKDYYAPMHTTEHILNQTMVRTFNCDRSFSNHIEKKKSKCDYKFDRDLTAEEITEIENKVNEQLRKNHDVTEEIISLEQAEKLYNISKLPEDFGTSVRIVHIGDYDSCPCSGVHVKNTGEIGTFKIISTSFENNVLRIRFKLIN